jgi:hypothetical protein
MVPLAALRSPSEPRRAAASSAISFAISFAFPSDPERG